MAVGFPAVSRAFSRPKPSTALGPKGLMGFSNFDQRGSFVLELNVRAKPTVVVPPPPTGDKSFLPLKEGKRYVLRNGVVTGAMEPHGDKCLISFTNVHGGESKHAGYYIWVKETGRFLGYGEDCDFNVVSEFFEVPAKGTILTPQQAKHLFAKGHQLLYAYHHGNTTPPSGQWGTPFPIKGGAITDDFIDPYLPKMFWKMG